MLPTSVSFDTQAINNNKENVIIHPLRNSNGRRPRTRRANTPSPIYLAREAARDPRRRRTLSPPVLAQKQSMHIAVDNDMDVDMGDIRPPELQRTLQLPRRLHRPIFKDISPKALEAVDPDLKDVALEYLREKLEMVGPELLAIAVNTTGDHPRDHLPRELQVLIQDMSLPPPTHIFAVYAKSSPRVFLHSAHAVVLAANCARLPLLPASKTDSTTSTASTMTLPVVPLRIPNPATFPTLLHYLYTKRANYLLAALLPLTLGNLQSPQHLSQHLAVTYTLPVLLTHAARIHGLWSNVVALGVFDDGLWKAIDLSWQVLLGAVASSTGAQWQTTQKL